MVRQTTVMRSSRLRASAADVWTAATSMDRINREMAPWLRMTYPSEAAGLTLDSPEVRLGEPLFTSYVLFLGVLPVERMLVTLTALEPGRRFVEQSRMLFIRSWRHERTIAPDGDGCVVTDQLTVEPPLPIFTPLVGAIVEAFFGHRHRQLRAFFGAAEETQSAH